MKGPLSQRLLSVGGRVETMPPPSPVSRGAIGTGRREKRGGAGVKTPKSFMAENTVFLLMTALIRNFYKAIMQTLDAKRFGLRANSRIKAFVFKFVSVPAKWIRTSRQHVLNIYTDNESYARLFQTDLG